MEGTKGKPEYSPIPLPVDRALLHNPPTARPFTCDRALAPLAWQVRRPQLPPMWMRYDAPLENVQVPAPW